MASVSEVFDYLVQIHGPHHNLKIAFLKHRLEKLESELPLKLDGNGVTKFFGDAQSLGELNHMESESKKEAAALREVFQAQYDVFAALAEVEIKIETNK